MLGGGWPENNTRKPGLCFVQPLCKSLGEVSLTGMNSLVFPTLRRGPCVPKALRGCQQPSHLRSYSEAHTAALGLHICMSHFFQSFLHPSISTPTFFWPGSLTVFVGFFSFFCFESCSTISFLSASRWSVGLSSPLDAVVFPISDRCVGVVLCWL